MDGEITVKASGAIDGEIAIGSAKKNCFLQHKMSENENCRIK